MKKDLKNETLKKIEAENLKPKPRAYFQVLKVALYSLTFGLAIAAIYIFNLIFYLPNRTLRIGQQEGWEEYFSLFPWPLILVGGLIVGILIYLYRNYEGGYKRHIGISALIIFAVVLVTGMVISRSNVNEKLEQRPHFQRFYQWNDDNFTPRGPRNRLRQPHYNFMAPQAPTESQDQWL